MLFIHAFFPPKQPVMFKKSSKIWLADLENSLPPTDGCTLPRPPAKPATEASQCKQPKRGKYKSEEPLDADLLFYHHDHGVNDNETCGMAAWPALALSPHPWSRSRCVAPAPCQDRSPPPAACPAGGRSVSSTVTRPRSTGSCTAGSRMCGAWRAMPVSWRPPRRWPRPVLLQRRPRLVLMERRPRRWIRDWATATRTQCKYTCNGFFLTA